MSMGCPCTKAEISGTALQGLSERPGTPQPTPNHWVQEEEVEVLERHSSSVSRRALFLKHQQRLLKVALQQKSLEASWRPWEIGAVLAHLRSIHLFILYLLIISEAPATAVQIQRGTELNTIRFLPMGRSWSAGKLARQINRAATHQCNRGRDGESRGGHRGQAGAVR